MINPPNEVYYCNDMSIATHVGVYVRQLRFLLT